MKLFKIPFDTEIGLADYKIKAEGEIT